MRHRAKGLTEAVDEKYVRAESVRLAILDSAGFSSGRVNESIGLLSRIEHRPN